MDIDRWIDMAFLSFLILAQFMVLTIVGIGILQYWIL